MLKKWMSHSLEFLYCALTMWEIDSDSDPPLEKIAGDRTLPDGLRQYSGGRRSAETLADAVCALSFILMAA